MEIIILMAVLGMAVTAMFSTVISGIYFSRDSENRIKAINLAREGLEGVSNIRNTNWFRFSGDKTNCWHIKDYDNICIGNSTYASSNSLATSTAQKYVLYQKNGAWYLTGASSLMGSGIWFDQKGFSYTSGTIVGATLCDFDTTTNCLSPFFREITLTLSGTDTIRVRSEVTWKDRRDHSIVLDSVITNWRQKF